MCVASNHTSLVLSQDSTGATRVYTCLHRTSAVGRLTGAGTYVQSRDMEEWLWDGQQQDTQYYNHGQVYNQEYGHHQAMAWSGNSAAHMHPPPQHAHVPQPPCEPYPGEPTPLCRLLHELGYHSIKRSTLSSA